MYLKKFPPIKSVKVGKTENPKAKRMKHSKNWGGNLKKMDDNSKTREIIL